MSERIGKRPRTMRDVWNEQVDGRGQEKGLKTSVLGFPVSIQSIDGSFPGESGQSSLEHTPEEFKVKDHVFRKPNKPLIVPEDERITWQVEVHEDYDTQGGMEVILQFSGIKFTNAPVFEKSRVDYGHDSSVFFSRIGYKNRLAFLILATYGDILESQVVAIKRDVGPFFREEILLPQLTVTHDITSMTVYEKNRLIVVNYNKL